MFFFYYSLPPVCVLFVSPNHPWHPLANIEFIWRLIDAWDLPANCRGCAAWVGLQHVERVGDESGMDGPAQQRSLFIYTLVFICQHLSLVILKMNFYSLHFIYCFHLTSSSWRDESSNVTNITLLLICMNITCVCTDYVAFIEYRFQISLVS